MEKSVFEATKDAVLQELAAGHDLSPKGSIDVPIRPLVDFINSIDGLVTTSSCSGRISVFRNDTSSGNKGINWLLVRHSPISLHHVQPFTGVISQNTFEDGSAVADEGTLTMLKVEGFIMHVHCRDADIAKDLQNVAFNCGFRESGIAISSKKVLVAIRTTAFGMELPLSSGTTTLLSQEALPIIVREMNTRLKANFARVDKLLTVLKEFYQWPSLRIEATIGQKHHKLERWGYVGAFVPTTSTGNANNFHILGGYGVDTVRNNNRKCQRNLSSIVLNESLEAKSPHASLSVDRVHAAGHLFHCSSSNSSNFIITGGRRSPQDAVKPFTQEYTFNEDDFHLCDSLEQGDVPSPRWGHSLTEIGDRTFFIFGGRDEKEIFGDGYILKHVEPNVWYWEKVFDIQVNDKAWKPCFFHAACQVSGHTVGDESIDEISRCAILVHGGCISLEEPLAGQDFIILYPMEKVWRTCTDAPMPCFRFGHTLTHLGFKSILLVGGTAVISDDIRCNEELPILILDYYMDNYGFIDIKLRKKLGSNGFLPCSSCRAHHGAFFDSKEKCVFLLGGGSPVLGFGTHYCMSAIVKITHDKVRSPGNGDNKLSKVNSSLSGGAGHKKGISPLDLIKEMIAGNNPMKNARTILVSKNKVKVVKNFLEKNELIDKSVRICKVHAGVEVQIVMRMDKSAVDFIALEYDEMAIPVVDEFYDELTNAPPDHMIWEVLKNDYAVFSFQPCPKAKAESVNKYTFVSAFIESFCIKWGMFRNKMMQRGGIIPTTGAKLRLEIVGDIMVIPEDVLCVSPWNGENIEHIDMLSELWTGLATCFGVKKVARKAKIDSGMKRESKVRLLMPPLGLPEDTGPGSPGWTTVVENGISFGFDITRVMFCSGNCTERMRVGTFRNLHEECVVDLYAGIGYYTIPYLIHAGAAVVHACEWNDNSVLALRHNLKAAGVNDDRCIIYHGDNRLEDTQIALAGKADRISLGLLPSSVIGWPLAANALKSTGGKLHVHENVHNDEITAWVDDTCKQLEALFLEKRGIGMDIQCEHVERVKSYAPKISHIVADLVCSPKTLTGD